MTGRAAAAAERGGAMACSGDDGPCGGGREPGVPSGQRGPGHWGPGGCRADTRGMGECGSRGSRLGRCDPGGLGHWGARESWVGWHRAGVRLTGVPAGLTCPEVRDNGEPGAQGQAGSMGVPVG